MHGYYSVIKTLFRLFLHSIKNHYSYFGARWTIFLKVMTNFTIYTNLHNIIIIYDFGTLTSAIERDKWQIKDMKSPKKNPHKDYDVRISALFWQFTIAITLHSLLQWKTISYFLITGFSWCKKIPNVLIFPIVYCKQLELKS